MTKTFFTPAFRKWAYGVATAALSVLLVYGIIDGEQFAALTGVASAVTLTAYLNTDTSTNSGMPKHFR